MALEVGRLDMPLVLLIVRRLLQARGLLLMLLPLLLLGRTRSLLRVVR